MKQLQQLIRNKGVQKRAMLVLTRLKHALFPVLLVCMAGLFIQEDDETGMYIMLVVIVLIVGLANFLRKFLPSRRKGKDGHGHNSQKGHSEGGS